MRSSMQHRLLISLAVVLAAGGCFGNTETYFPPGLEPLESNTAPLPDPATEGILYTTGKTADYDWAHARAVIHAPAAAVWQALKDPDVLVSWRQTTRHTFVLTPDAIYEFRYMLSYEVDNIITVTWDEDWRLGTIKGTPAAPELGMLRYQKVYGSTFIDLIEGSIQVVEIDDTTTEVQFVEHLKALQSGSAESVTTMQDRFAAIAARAHGQPLPPR
jgi:uncharacterized protein YndB with AHSA1/START domain